MPKSAIMGSVAAAGVEPPPYQPDLGERAYRLLYDEIIRCRILPGQDITEAQICLRYDISRSPVRRALALLTHDGLITPTPRLGFHVSDISLATIRQTYEMRASLEGLAARASVGRVNIDVLRQLNKEYVDCAHADSINMLAAHNKIHTVIYAASNNPILEQFLTQLLNQSNRINYFLPIVGGKGYPGSNVTAEGHDELIDALESKDPDKAAACFHAHVKLSEQRATEAILLSRHFSDLPIRVDDRP